MCYEKKVQYLNKQYLKYKSYLVDRKLLVQVILLIFDILLRIKLRALVRLVTCMIKITKHNKLPNLIYVQPHPIKYDLLGLFHIISNIFINDMFPACTILITLTFPEPLFKPIIMVIVKPMTQQDHISKNTIHLISQRIVILLNFIITLQ